MKQPIDELEIFKPVDESLKDENEWPIFSLVDVDVTSVEDGKLADLLLVDEKNAVNVTGKIGELDRTQRHHLIDRDSLSFPNNVIIIPSVQRYSFGQYEDGEVAFWARGRAGWFEIKPSRRYRQMHKNMQEALQILYFCSDTFRGMNTRKQQRRTSPETLFESYADDAGYRCRSAHEARNRFVKHKEQLLALMRDGKEGISWKLTAIFKWLINDPEEMISEAEEITLKTPQRPTAYDTSSDDDTAAHLARKGKSALRPKSGQGEGKGRPTEPMNIDSLDDDIIMEDVLIPSPFRRKSQDYAVDNRPTKRRRGRPPKNRPIEEQIKHIPSQRLPNDVPGELLLPLKDKRPPPQKAPPAKMPNHRVDIVTTPLPTFAANSPGDVWACSYDGCSHRVYGASSVKSKELIEEHYKHHTLNSQAQIDLAYAEERPYLPVGNLINRIREMAAKHQVAGQPERKEPAWKKELKELPKAIQQRY